MENETFAEPTEETPMAEMPFIVAIDEHVKACTDSYLTGIRDAIQSLTNQLNQLDAEQIALNLKNTLINRHNELMSQQTQE